MTYVDIGTALAAFGIVAVALEDIVLTVICFGVAAWVLS